MTTGANPVTTELASSPPHELAFGTTVSGQVIDVIQNSKGEFACSRGVSSSATWSCIEVKGAEAATYKVMYALYSGAYWIDFLRLYSAAAALQGVTIHSTTMSVNGFALQCDVIVNKKNPSHEQVVRDIAGGSRLRLGVECQSGLRDQELLGVPAGFAVPGPGRGDDHDNSHDDYQYDLLEP